LVNAVGDELGAIQPEPVDEEHSLRRKTVEVTILTFDKVCL